MKLLLDENLSRRLVPALQGRWPGSSQVGLLGLEGATDAELCRFAAEQEFVIVSKDDFQRLVAARGYRPRLLQIALGNVSNDAILGRCYSARTDAPDQRVAEHLHHRRPSHPCLTPCIV